MENTWNYKIDVKSDELFEEISKKINKEFPEDLRTFLMEHNASTPIMNCVRINGVERVYSETLSFNSEESEATSVLSMMRLIDEINCIPFALDPFGNVFCYSLKNSTIVFYNHEEQSLDDTNLNLSDFVESLYKE